MRDENRSELPACGLYRTTRPLSAGETTIAEATLVNFHNHSEEGSPVVLLPAFNVFNRWQWTAKPAFVRDPSWLRSLRQLPAEGFYALGFELPADERSAARWPKGSLVQLGYDRGGVGIAFLAQLRHNLSENSLWFAEHGVRLNDEQLGLLEPLVVYEEPDPLTAGAEKGHAR